VLSAHGLAAIVPSKVSIWRAKSGIPENVLQAVPFPSPARREAQSDRAHIGASQRAPKLLPDFDTDRFIWYTFSLGS
jgi:hypothetical protein